MLSLENALPEITCLTTPTITNYSKLQYFGDCLIFIQNEE